MSPMFRFMTGANMYRCEASSREEAIQVAVESLNPNADTRAVIESTMYEEGTEAHVVVEREPDAGPDSDDAGEEEAPEAPKPEPRKEPRKRR